MMICRHCKSDSTHIFLDLHMSPPSNAYLTKEELNCRESYYPLRVYVCDKCWLVQTEDFAAADELFTSSYAYFSSTSSSFLSHAKDYFCMAVKKFNLSSGSYVVEIASNDGYLLRNFVEAGIPCLGIEPTSSTAKVAESIGVPVLKEFFGSDIASQYFFEKKANLIIGNNVLAHVPDINDFIKGLKIALDPEGVITLEFPHLMQLIKGGQFDTIYHEHFSYLSLRTVSEIFLAYGLKIFDVEEIVVHGGSLRIYVSHVESPVQVSANVFRVLKCEDDINLFDLKTYFNFSIQVEAIKLNFLSFLLEKKKSGQSVMAYGAAAKGNTLLNYVGVTSDLISCVFDASESKQGKFMPGSRIPILSPERLRELHPEYIIVLPWNIASEVAAQLSYLRDRGTKFLIAVPSLQYI